ncbi:MULTISPECIES: hypothetical protein [unclassified Crossiella]|uniref:hypothetical protein n=1 Tax=unclassified Crossiella TaxID=2620835 RepID=UPI0020004A71|nr:MULTISPECIES: hypothetical protein [unclassified Crossiella]MCK2237167.1 hypothetical protein [Crossiella sp. S99.2]MCK2252522.1 hypothetical protein [Crossiella sp. S99.1]
MRLGLAAWWNALLAARLEWAGALSLWLGRSVFAVRVALALGQARAWAWHTTGRVRAWRCWALLGRAGRCLGRHVAAGARWVWHRAQPPARDALGWLRHTAPPLLRRALARQARRALRRGPRVLGRLITSTVIGLVWLLGVLGRYCLALDFAPLVAEATRDGKPKRAKHFRDTWRKTAIRRTLLLGVLAALVWWGATRLLARFGNPAEVGLVLAAVAVCAFIGTRVRPGAPGPEDAPEAEAGPDEPYPLADAHTRAEVAECLRRALLAERIELRSVEDVARQPWGWEAAAVLKRGTPADLVSKLDAITTTLDLPTRGVLATPDRHRAARIVLRMAKRDPFEGLPEALYRAPNSLSIRDPHVIGRRMDGGDLSVALQGVHGIVVGLSGAGKSVALRALADVVTACRDAIAWDLDPAGNGLDCFGDAVGRRARTPEEITDALTVAYSYAAARPGMLSALGMGEAWRPSAERPALVVFIDEYARLTPEAKALTIGLLGIGRKSRVTVILGTTEATSDTLGEAIAESAALRILMPCRHADVRLMLGPNRIAEGWRPDRLNAASGDDPEDAGKLYMDAIGSREPIVSKIRALSAEHAWERGEHRASLGRPEMDAATRARAQRLRPSPALSAPVAGKHRAAEPQADPQAVADILSVFRGEARLWTEELIVRLTAQFPRYRSWGAEQIADALRPWGISSQQIKRDGRNRNGYDRAAIQAAYRERG